MEISRGIIENPWKVLIYGPEGIGKTTFAAHFPKPLFIDTEGGTARLDVARLPAPSSWEYLMQEVDFVIREKPCETLVIDTADWAEKLCIKSICDKNGVDNIESFGYGKGYVVLATEFGKLLNKLNDVIEAGINVVLTAHSIIKKFEQPDEMGAYDRYELKLERKTAPLVKEWADMILFATYQTYIVEDSKTKSKKATGGKRIMHTTHNPCWDAKNRSGLDDTLDFDFNEISYLFAKTPKLYSTNNTVRLDTPKEEPKEAPKMDTSPIEDDGPVELSLEPTPEPEIVEGDMIPNIDYTSPEYEGLIPEVIQLMEENMISADALKAAVADAGIVPVSTPFTAYPEDWQRGDLVANWDEWLKRMNDIPF